MVKSLGFFLFAAQAMANPVPRLLAEFPKTSFYEGETVHCQFSLYAPDVLADIEVAKFPEFRGYWSENTALRQGPNPLLLDGKFPGMRKLLVGAYLLTPMIHAPNPQVTPLRLVVTLPGDPKEQLLVAEVPPLKILPLPPVPPALRSEFTGAVGQFQLRAESPVVRFYEKEPTVLRYALLGSGNFPEIDALSFPDVPNLKVVHQNASSTGSGTFQTKFFEITVLPETSQTLEVPPLRFVFFDPRVGQYNTTTADPVKMEALPKPPAAESEPALDWGGMERQWHPARPWEQSAGFWALQFLLGTVWLSLLGRRLWRAWRRRRATDPRVQLRARWKALFQDTTTADPAWLELAEKLAYESVGARTRRPLVTRREAVEFARKRWDAKTAQTLEALFEEQTRRFHPPPAPGVSPRSTWQPRLRQLRRALLA